MDFRARIEQMQEELIAHLQGCIQIPSVEVKDDSGYPYGKPVADCLAYMLELASAMGFATYNMDNHVGWCEYGEGDEMVVVLGHLDVVPEGDGWTVPPYAGLVQDGRIYGRGTMDDKGPTVAALYALYAIKQSGVKLDRRVRIVFGCNEETGSADLKYYAAHGGEMPVMGFTPDGEYPVINGEKGLINEEYTCRYTPAGALRLKELWGGTAHNIVPDKAWAAFACDAALAKELCAMHDPDITVCATEDGIRVDAVGVNAHGGTPWEGVNAIGKLCRFLTTLPLEGELATAIRFLAERIGLEWNGASMGIALHDEVSGDLTLNLGTIRGDGETVVTKLNYRYPVTKHFDDCGPQLQAAFSEAGFERTQASHKAGLYMAPDSPLVTKLMEVYTRCTGLAGEPKSIGGGTYAKMMPNVLAFGPIFPGDEVREHKPDEYMELSRLIDNAHIIAEAIYAMATK